MESLDKITVRAQLECAIKQIDIDVYEVEGGFAYRQRSLRKSEKHVKRCSYEKGKVIIKDNKGKVLDTVDCVKKAEAKPAPEKAKESKSKDA